MALREAVSLIILYLFQLYFQINTEGLHRLEVRIPELDQNGYPARASMKCRTVINPQQDTNFSVHAFDPTIPPPGLSAPYLSRPASNASLASIEGNRVYHFDLTSENSRPASGSMTIPGVRTSTNTSARQTPSYPGLPQMNIQSRQSNHPFRQPYGTTYSTMPTPCVSSARSSVFDARNWRTDVELDMLERAAAEQLQDAESTPNDPVASERLRNALEAELDDRELISAVLSYKDE
jgi:hypothetical protein